MHEGALSKADKCAMCETTRAAVGTNGYANVDEEEHPALVHNQQTASANIEEGECPALVLNQQTNSTKTSSPRRKTKLKCMHGSNCKNLKKSNCRFAHPPEQHKFAAPAKSKNPRDKATTVEIPASIFPAAASAPTATMKTNPADDLRFFLKTQKQCLKVSPDKFFKWLMGEDIVCLSDLLDALNDDEYKAQLIINGLKKFKSPVFQREAERAIEQSGPENSKTSDLLEIPDELLCPITHSIFVDPVVAKDGFTY